MNRSISYTKVQIHSLEVIFLYNMAFEHFVPMLLVRIKQNFFQERFAALQTTNHGLKNVQHMLTFFP